MQFGVVNINYDWAKKQNKAYFAEHFTHLLTPEQTDEAWDLVQKQKQEEAKGPADED